MESLITGFYTAFQNLDAESMVSYYHDDIVFEDPAFGVLKGEKAKNMWRMLCKEGKDLCITFSDVKIEDGIGKVRWEAHYTFRKTGKKVHNTVRATFEFKDDKISKHTDMFDLHNWSKQALGFSGWLLGGTSFFKRKFNEQANKTLDWFEKKN